MKNRSRLLQDGTPGEGNVLYWMSREQRVTNNAALIFASYLAKENGKQLEVLFVIDDTYPGANLRSFTFMIEGMEEVKLQLESLGIPFCLQLGKIPSKVTEHIHLYRNAIVVMDFNPLRHALFWKNQLLSSVSIPVYEVDGHNIVPCWIASDKQEYAARTFRPKVNRLLTDYLYPLPQKETIKQELPFEQEIVDWKGVLSSLRINRNIAPSNKPSGEKAAREVLNTFINERIKDYTVERNHIRVNVCSELSPYIHFGQISTLEIALEVMRQCPADENREAFLEQLIVRKELAENFCYYNPYYDSFKGFPSWAQKSLLEHQSDEREYLYSRSEFEQAKTNDSLWNEAQNTLVQNGTMHNYLRMYWGKKILEWSVNAEEAMQTAIYLNDKYQLDGRDPNGYTGCAWCIGGVHDRPWFRHPVFGNVRYMGSKKLSHSK
ncbi:deoxyribodipyrimidine photo-lyase [uncultured Bacteroides sp.]|uniref:deoxyribodipyrimidine photo-lyase n=1 Tax=uncultured Bacteroides sp. TaxID=162156 RepID=UPI002AABA53C|nr:deoxyribodipyrimidine photo-lyase [uncultured Bacteroides sp.]